MESTIYNTQGKSAGKITLPEDIFGAAWNAALMHQVVTSMQDNARTNVAHAKGRNEVRGGGRKPWQQKGTGRARVGSIRSPIWRGGGVTHGPNKNQVFAREIPRKMKLAALKVALSRKMKDGEILFIDSFGFANIPSPKTALAKKSLNTLAKLKGFERLVGGNGRIALVALSEKSEAADKSFRNLGFIDTTEVRELNAHEVMKHRYLVFENPDAAIAILSTRFTKKSRTPKPEKAETKKVK